MVSVLVDKNGTERSMGTSLFADAPPPGYVRRTGKIFEVGDYPDKNFSLTEAEADKAIASFEGAPIGLEHVPTVLNGKLGMLRKMWREGKEIHGAVDVPVWLHEVLDEASSQVSSAWDRATKTVKGVDWVLDPRVSGAALMSAYADFSAREAERGSHAKQTKAKNTDKRRVVNMGLREALSKSLQATFGRADADKPVEPEKDKTPKQTTINFSAPGTAPEADSDEEGEEGDAMFSQFRVEQITTRAAEVADRLVADGHIMSSGRPLAMALFSQMGLDNEEAGPGVVTFSKADGTVLSDRVAMVNELLANHTPKHELFSRKLPVNVYNGEKDVSEQKSAAQIGREQAERFNRTLPGYQAMHNGNGLGAATVNGHMNGNGHSE